MGFAIVKMRFVRKPTSVRVGSCFPSSEESIALEARLFAALDMLVTVGFCRMRQKIKIHSFVHYTGEPPNTAYFEVQNTDNGVFWGPKYQLVSKIRCQNTKLFIAFCCLKYDAFCFGIFRSNLKYVLILYFGASRKIRICNIKILYFKIRNLQY